jgi:hypothetical protein
MLSIFSSSLQQISYENIPTLRPLESELSLILIFSRVLEDIMRLAVEHIRRMHGGTQAHLMRCDDGEYYVIKFKNNPQHLRTLANDLFATRLAAWMGICVPEVDIVEVRSSLIENTPDLVMQMSTGRLSCASGKQFGSKFPGNPSMVTIYDHLPDEHLDRVQNINEFLGIFVFDKWTCQTDKRQVIFIQQSTVGAGNTAEKGYKAMMIDQGFCFDGGSWSFPDAPLHSLYFNRRVYESVIGIDAFYPWVDRLETGLTSSILFDIGKHVPSEWYGEDHEGWERLIERLYLRRKRVRELIWSAGNALCGAFPNWNRYASPRSVIKSPRGTTRVA